MNFKQGIQNNANDLYQFGAGVEGRQTHKLDFVMGLLKRKFLPESLAAFRVTQNSFPLQLFLFSSFKAL